MPAGPTGSASHKKSLRTRRLKAKVARLSYSIVLDPAEEGGFTVRVPRLPGCVTEGDTVEEALANARDAITAYLLSLLDEHENLPPADDGRIRVYSVDVDLNAA